MAIENLFEQYQRSPKELRLYMENLRQNTPPPLSASIEERPDKEEAIEGYVSRFAHRQIVH
ncbi:MAG: hypothetical protein DSY43_02760 [Gammaproteobacteria bacterium]|nr:MAG: hypothetical protein DSY43_02760 [Gammaproteobacteria bacterium]